MTCPSNNLTEQHSNLTVLLRKISIVFCTKFADMHFSMFFAGLNRAAKSMLQKFKTLPMAYLAAYQIASKLPTKNAKENSKVSKHVTRTRR